MMGQGGSGFQVNFCLVLPGRLRMVYDRVGRPLARRMTNPYVADVAYLLLQPFEWGTMGALKACPVNTLSYWIKSIRMGQAAYQLIAKKKWTTPRKSTTAQLSRNEGQYAQQVLDAFRLGKVRGQWGRTRPPFLLRVNSQHGQRLNMRYSTVPPNRYVPVIPRYSEMIFFLRCQEVID
ncbi:MAG: hypothetical protein BWK76_09030 [Desulfobulbaceae bacterium A2]|nr:MAG: hypothetical protein BWK76_09030 [Desulfobulbaceae bacterium A2]